MKQLTPPTSPTAVHCHGARVHDTFADKTHCATRPWIRIHGRDRRDDAVRRDCLPEIRGAWTLAILLAALPAYAQEAAGPATVPAATAPTTQVETSATAPTTAPATQAVAPSTPAPAPVVAPASRPYDPFARVTFNFKDASVESVLDKLSESLGFIIIKDGRVDGRVTMMSRQAIGADDAVELLNSVLKPINYTAIRTGRVLRVVSRDKAKKANIPVHLGANPAEVRQTDELITQVIPLVSVDAVKLRQDLQALFNPEADVTANAASNTIIMTDTSANIRRIVEIVAAMDRTMSSTSDIKVFQLQYASASAAAKLVNDLFKQDQPAAQPQGGGGRRFGGFPGMGGGFPGMPGMGGQAGAADTGARIGKVVASSDDRTNTLVVTGPSGVLTVIADVVKQLDSNPSQTTKVFVYSLRNGQAQNMQNVLNTLFGVSGTSLRSSGATSSRQPFGGTSSAFGGGGGGGFGGGGTFGGFGGMTGRGMSSFFGGTAAGLSASSRAIASELTGQVYVVADADTNSLIITTAAKYEDQVRAILVELDRSVPQVLIKVLLAEVTHTNTSDLGVQGSILNLWSLDPQKGEKVGTDFGLADQKSGLVASIVEDNFQLTLRALATEGKLNVLSRPYILTSDNQLASILVGQEVPFITNTRITDTGQTVNTIQYQDIGIILNVTPHINPDGKVIMDVAPEISSIAPDQTVEISPGVNASVFNKRSAQSRVAIENGKTIVIGGLMEDKKTTAITKVPLLGDIPYAGALFRRSQDNKTKTELLIFLTPHVVRESATLHGMSKDEMKGAKIVPDAIAPGAFAEHLQGLQRGSTTQPVEPIYVPRPPATQKSK